MKLKKIIKALSKGGARKAPKKVQHTPRVAKLTQISRKARSKNAAKAAALKAAGKVTPVAKKAKSRKSQSKAKRVVAVKTRLRAHWEAETLQPLLQKSPESRPEFKTVSNALIDRLYNSEDLSQFTENGDLGFPGEYPFTRGVYPSMHRGRLWTMRQFAGFGTAEDTNQRFKYLLAQI
jgi:hypothetical protein